MLSLRSLFSARPPRNALVVDQTEVAAVELRRDGVRFAMASASVQRLPAGYLNADFDQPNLCDLSGFAGMVERVAEAAGLQDRARWSVLLPESTLRTVAVTFDSVPATKAELHAILSWKVEHAVGVPATELRVGRQFVDLGGSPRFLVVVARDAVVREYEDAFKLLGWQPGLITPRYIGEAAWLDWDQTPGDKLVVASRPGSFVTAFVRAGSVVFVRIVDGDRRRLADEIYRLALHYKERIADPQSTALACLLVEPSLADLALDQVVADAIAVRPRTTWPIPDYLQLDGQNASYPSLVAASGIATLAWAH
jgi:hypothetical protein